jgi:hypothetical protein
MSNYYTNYSSYLGANRCCNLKSQGPQGPAGPQGPGAIGPAGVQGPVNPRNMQDAEGPSNKRDMHDGEGPSDQRSLQDHYVTIDSKTVERRTVELGKRIDPSMADPQQAAAQVKKEPLFTMADATPWSLSLRLEARLKDVGSKTSDIHNQIDRLEVDALNLGKRIKI